jgi:APA family basic amino acid/polyamine antiporter
MAGRGLGQLFARKSVEQMHAEHQGGELKKSLGAINLVLLGIGCIIGTGIFVLTGRAAAEFAGPGIMISFVITGVLCALVALCYSELAAAIPVSGSAYSYSYASLGEFVAWIMGVLLLLEYGVAASTVAVGWSGYTVQLLDSLGITIPAALTAAPGVSVIDPVTQQQIAVGIVNLPALIGIIAVTALLTLGVSESATVNNIVVAIKVTVVIAFILIGFFFVNPANWSPLIPEQIPAPPPGADTSLLGQIWSALGNVVTGQSRESAFGIGGLISAASVIFFAYIGFEAVSTAGAEAKNPARDMPIGILGSLIVCTILYILTCAVLVGLIPYTMLSKDDPAPIATAINYVNATGQADLRWFEMVVEVGAFAGLSSVMLVLLYGQTRIFYTMARDGLLPSIFAKVNNKTKTPVANTLVVGAVAAGFAGFTGLDFLGDTTNVGTLVAFMFICITVVYLRFSRPDLNRPFRMPTWLIVGIAVLGASMCAILVMSLMSEERTRNFFMWYLIIGVLFYFVYGMWNSKLAKGEVVTGHEANPDLESKGLTDVEPPFKN